MIFKKEEILTKLNSIKAGLSNKDIMQFGKSFIFSGTEVISFNDQISIGIEMKTDFTCMVPADELLKVIAKTKKDDIEITFNEGVLDIKSGKLSSQLKCSQENLAEFLLQLRPESKMKWNVLPKDFFDAVLMTVFSASSDMTKPYLTCLNIKKDRIISSDNLRVSQFIFKEEMKHEFLLPALAAKELVKFKDITQYHLLDSWIYFKNDSGIIFCSRILDNEFPDVSSFFEIAGHKFIFPDEASSAIGTASVFADGDFDFDKKIKVNITDKKMTCKGEQETGWISEEIDIDVEQNFSFIINPFFFAEVLKHTQRAKIIDNVILFYSKNFQHLIMLFSDEK